MEMNLDIHSHLFNMFYSFSFVSHHLNNYHAYDLEEKSHLNINSS